MECPKCGAVIDDKALVCPNCKKVLKIVCPVCRTVNETNICRKCGEILVTKCFNCGKINLLKNEKCVKCGYSNEISALQNESNAESFATIKINFLNEDVIKNILGSNKVYLKFKSNLDKMINDYVKSLGLRRQILKDGTYVIRFNKVYTFESSAKSAMEAAIEIVNRITRVNVKLIDKKDVGLRCTLTILKQFANKDPYDLDSGLNITLLNQESEKQIKALDYCNIITDEDFYETYNSIYKLESLDSTLVQGEMKRFFEIDVKDFINIDEYLKELKLKQNDESEDVPNFVQEAMELEESLSKSTFDVNAPEGIELYTINELINFEEINCAFYTTENVRVLDNVVEVLQEVPRGICAIRGSNLYQPYTLRLLAGVDELGIYKNVIPITCHDEMKYTPYSFFRELVSSIFEYAVSPKLSQQNDFSIFESYDPDGLIKDLVSLNQREMHDIQDTRQKYYTVFLSLLQSIPDSLIYIENFEKIDESSLYVLSLLFEDFEDMNISYIISYDESFSLHKRFHFMLSRPYYTEITLLPTKFVDIVSVNEDYYKNILTDFYFRKIAKYASGSTLFMDYAIQYLIESDVYAEINNSLEMINPITIIIPSNLSGLIQRRLNYLKNDKDAIMFLAICVLMGARVDIKTIATLGFKNWEKIVEKLTNMGHLYVYNDCIYFPNYQLLRENIIAIIHENNFEQLKDLLFENFFTDEMPSSLKVFLYDKLDEHDKVVLELEKLANLGLSLGDIFAYLNCSSLILKKMDQYSIYWSENDLKQYKSSIYENISNNLFEYNSSFNRELVNKTLEDLLKNNNIKNYIDLCSRMVQGAIENGEYLYALNLTHKILSLMDDVSFDPGANNFSMDFMLISIIHVKILFGIGAFKDCVDIGYNILNVLDSVKINSIEYENITKEDFISLLIECIGYVAMSIVFSLKDDVVEFLDIANKLFDFIPKEYQIFVQLQKLLQGERVNLVMNMKGQNIFSNILYHLIKAFTVFKDKPQDFAQEVYKAKLIAQETYLPVFEIFADLLIGYSYVNLNSYMKADAILKEIIKTSQEKGMNVITYLALYISSILNIKEEKYDIAYGLLNNESIQMEKSGAGSIYLIFLNKICMARLLKLMSKDDKSDICLEQAKYIIEKYDLKYDLNSF